MAFLFVNKHSNAVKQESEADKIKDERTQQIREALKNYIHKNNMENSIAKEKNANILNSLLEN